MQPAPGDQEGRTHLALTPGQRGGLPEGEGRLRSLPRPDPTTHRWMAVLGGMRTGWRRRHVEEGWGSPGEPEPCSQVWTKTGAGDEHCPSVGDCGGATEGLQATGNQVTGTESWGTKDGVLEGLVAAESCWDWQEIWESSRLRSPEARRMAVSRCGPCREECFGRKMGGFTHPGTLEPLVLCTEKGCRTLPGVAVAAALPDKALLPRGDVQSHQRGLTSPTRPYSCFYSYRRVCQTQRMTSRRTGAFSELVVVWGAPSAVAQWFTSTALKMLPVEHLSAYNHWLQFPGVCGQQRPVGTGSCRGTLFLPTCPSLRMDTRTCRGGHTQQTGRASGAASCCSWSCFPWHPSPYRLSGREGAT